MILPLIVGTDPINTDKPEGAIKASCGITIIAIGRAGDDCEIVKTEITMFGSSHAYDTSINCSTF
jgi:hypothetical protein